MKFVCVWENMTHISRVYADEPRCKCIHTKTESVYKRHFIHCLGKRVFLKNHRQWTQQQHRERTTTSMTFSQTPDCSLMSVQTLHRNECITVHWFFFYLFFFRVDLLPVVWGRKVITEDKTIPDMWQIGACAVSSVWWSNMTKRLLKTCCLSSDYIFICRVWS